MTRRPAQYFRPRLDLVRDMRELLGLPGLVGFRFDETIGTPNNSTADRVKRAGWPKDKSSLSNCTVDALSE